MEMFEIWRYKSSESIHWNTDILNCFMQMNQTFLAKIVNQMLYESQDKNEVLLN